MELLQYQCVTACVVFMFSVVLSSSHLEKLKQANSTLPRIIIELRKFCARKLFFFNKVVSNMKGWTDDSFSSSLFLMMVSNEVDDSVMLNRVPMSYLLKLQ